MVNGLDHYQQIIDSFEQRVSHGQRPTRMESMGYHTARRELYLHQAMEAMERGDPAYNFLNSKAEECNVILMTLHLGDSSTRPHRSRKGLDDFAGIRRQMRLLTGISA